MPVASNPKMEARVVAVALVLLGAACPARSTVDEVLGEYARLRNELSEVGCACPLTIGPGPMGMAFATEQECLDAATPIDENAIECMAKVLEGTSHDEKSDITLIECYNAALEEAVACKRENLEVCSTEASNDCVYSWADASDHCDVAYSSTADELLEAREEMEAFFVCGK